MEKTIADLLTDVPVIAVLGNEQTKVTSLTTDSRKARKESMFFAIRGTAFDGQDFIPQAMKSGAVAVVCQKMPNNLDVRITYILVEDAAIALGQIASNFYDRPADKLKIIGVTGTNGKTTVATLLHDLFRELGYSAGLLSTVQNQVNDEVIKATLTTPDPIVLNELLAEMVKANCTHCFMEVSSHALVQKRVANVSFAGGIFTNISHDHLDYHGSFDEYIYAKKIFFDKLPEGSFALVNADDKRAEVMLQNTAATKQTYSLRKMADFKGRVIENSLQGLHMEIDGQEAMFKLIGSFNAYNLLAVYGAAILLGEDKQEVLTILSGLDAVTGRFEFQRSGTGISAIVDYAHTPDALGNVLETIKEVRKEGQRVITVIGCGGNRDASKRPLMAQIAMKNSDELILTTDNPRDEEPEEILQQMVQGLSEADQVKALKIADRKEAIKTACHLARPEDIILVAGKGHETYQEIKGERHPFDDRQVLIETFDLMKK